MTAVNLAANVTVDGALALDAISAASVPTSQLCEYPDQPAVGSGCARPVQKEAKV